MIQLNGVTIECQQSGAGPALLFLPGSYSTPAAWRPIQRLLEPRWRMVTTSLRGYGESTDTRSHDDIHVTTRAAFALTVGAILVAAWYGARFEGQPRPVDPLRPTLLSLTVVNSSRTTQTRSLLWSDRSKRIAAFLWPEADSWRLYLFAL